MSQEQTFEEHVTETKKQLEEHPEDGRVRYNWACILIAQGKYDEAEEELKKAVQLQSELAEAFVQLGGLAMRKGDLNLCLSYNQQAAKVRHRFAVPHGNIGFVHLQKGNVQEAIKSLRRAVSFDPKFVQAIATLGSAYFMEGDPDGCIEQSKKALDLQPTFGPAYNNLCLAYLEKKEYGKAVENCDLAQKYGYEVPAPILEELKPHRNAK